MSTAKRDERPAVVVTGISGNLGRTIARILHREERIIGIDRRPFRGKPKDIVLHRLDIRRKKAGDIFRRHRVKALVHMGIVHDPRLSPEEHHSFNVVGTQRILEYCVKHGVEKVVVLSSANVYGPDPNNSNFLTEEAPLRAAVRHGDVRDLVEVDMYAQSFFWRHPQVETVILRPVHIVGPSVRNAPSNYLRMKRPWVMAGFDPNLQLIHQEDVARAICKALEPGVRGVFNVTGPGVAPLSRILEMLGRRPIPVPHFVAGALVEKLWTLRLTSFPPPELDHIRYLCVVDGSAFEHATGYAPAYSLRETVLSVDAR
ncbi:MAG: SDR family oxidoreductase [Deltaproteobacteria bacterium]|nr:MAG: SDR family oxidoreductase [Deltaproteobacteria bacterium]